MAADEVAGWLADPRPYNKGKHRGAWAGAIEDLIDSLSRLGPHAQKALADELAATRAALAGFPGQADSPDRAPAQTAVETLRRRWNDPLVWEAAWRDLLDACRDDGTSYDVLAARRDLLWRLAAFTQRPPLDLSERLSSVLDRSPCAVPQARLRLGESTAAMPGAETEPDAHPEVSEEELLELCRRLLLQPPTSGRHVVWLAFVNAASPRVVERTGALTLYDGNCLRERLREHAATPQADIPEELLNPRNPISIGYRFVPEGDDVVLIRADLGEGTFGDAVQTARERVHALVGLARFRTADHAWQPLHGYLHALDGRVVRVERFRPAEPSRRRPRESPVGHTLTSLTATLWDKLARANADLAHTAAAVHWWEQAQLQPSPAALVLNVRVLEVTATRVAIPDWISYLDTYLQSGWIRAVMYDTLFQTVNAALADAEHAVVDHHGELRALVQTFHAPQATSIAGFDAVAALAALPRLQEIYPLHTRTGRRLLHLSSRLQSPATLAAWSEELSERWKRARNRLRRSRNAIAHGGPVIGQVIASLDDMSRYLAAWSLSLLLDGTDTGQALVQPHQSFCEDADRWRQGLPSASDVGTALFPDA
ncbi:hypothetical protein AB0J43_04080 [Nonomuraea fuscirosea]